MKHALGLLTLTGLAVSTPFHKRQDLNLVAYNDIPTVTVVDDSDGLTAPQAITAAYDPSAAAASAAVAAVTVLTVDAATPTGTSVHKRDTPPGNATGCTTLATTGNAPGTTPDTPQDFLANPVYANAALNARTPNGYSAVFVNKQASAQDPSYLTYTTKGMTSYDPKICAGYCTALAGCSSFNIHYERDPAYTTSSTCQNPPSTVFLKCDLYGAPLTAASATNVGQWRSQFHTAHAGSNAYTVSAPDAIPGFQGPVSLGNAITNAPYSFLGSQSFPTTQPYDPSVCAAACEATTARNKANQGANGIYDTCRYFVAFVLYKNGQKGVFTCNYYSDAWDTSYATNTGQTDSSGNVYTIGFSFSYTLDPVYGTPGTGLTYYAYNNPYPPPASGNFPSLDAFQSANYFATGIIQDIPGTINFGDYGTCSIEGQSLPNCPDVFGLAMKGFFIASQTGTYTFSAPNVDDYWYMYHGDKALSGWNANNADAQAHWLSGGYSYSITLTKGYILPILLLYVNQGGPGRALFNTQFPDGTTTTGTTGLFTPVNPSNNPFLFTETP